MMRKSRQTLLAQRAGDGGNPVRGGCAKFSPERRAEPRRRRVVGGDGLDLLRYQGRGVSVFHPYSGR